MATGREQPTTTPTSRQSGNNLGVPRRVERVEVFGLELLERDVARPVIDTGRADLPSELRRRYAIETRLGGSITCPRTHSFVESSMDERF